MSEEKSETVRITVTVKAEVAERIAELARRLESSDSRLASVLLESAVEDFKWLHEFLTSRLVVGVVNYVQGWGKASRAKRS